MKPTIITFSGSARHGKSSSQQILTNILHDIDKRVLRADYGLMVKYYSCLFQDQSHNIQFEQLIQTMFEKNENSRTKWQLLGTEKVRDAFPNFWVDNIINVAKVFENDYDYILIADCRFPNEISRWIEEGYDIITIHVDRPKFENELTQAQRMHRSETSLNNFNFDIYLSAKDLIELRYEIMSKVIPILFGG